MISWHSDARHNTVILYSSLKTSAALFLKQSVYAFTKNAVWSRHYMYSDDEWCSKLLSFKSPLVILPYNQVMRVGVHLLRRSLLMFILLVSKKCKLHPSSMTFRLRTVNMYSTHFLTVSSFVSLFELRKINLMNTFWIVISKTSS